MATRDKKALLKLVQEAIDNGATTAEDIHKSIARLPLKVLEDLNLLRGPAKKVDRIQDRAIGAIYDLIREINERVAEYAAKLLAKAGSARAAKPAAPVRKRAAASKPAKPASKRAKAAPKRAAAAPRRKAARKKA